MLPEFYFAEKRAGRLNQTGAGWEQRQKYRRQTKREGKYSETGFTILIIALFAADLKAFYSIKTV